ncbi:MAG: 2Fe-2S iron-sulfur cluster-binding protein [Pseudomonadota bacterium]
MARLPGHRQEIHHCGRGRDWWIHRTPVRQEKGRGHLIHEPPSTFRVQIEPGGHDIRVPPGENVLAAALAAGIPLPYSCRAGRCASCKSRLLSGTIEYPAGTPPGITPSEVARGEVLLCQARPRSDLQIESLRVPVRASGAATGEIISIEPLAMGALRVRLRILAGTCEAKPGQYVDVRNHAGDGERLAVTARGENELDLEAVDDGSVLHRWLAGQAAHGSALRVAGPFDRPRQGT